MTALDQLPLYANDDQIGRALLGAKKATVWKEFAPLYERQGLPKIDAVFGGRYVPAVKRWLDAREGLGGDPIMAKDGVEDLSAWNKRGSARRV